MILTAEAARFRAGDLPTCEAHSTLLDTLLKAAVLSVGMLHKKIGIPQEGEIVLCTVTNVQYNSVFCTLDEYRYEGQEVSGMIHISEVSAGRIRNIREFVQEGKKVYCKILTVDKQRGHIDLSLRRVTEGQKRDKNMTLKQEQKAENILDHLAKEKKVEPAKFYQDVAIPILERYEYVYMAFEDIVEEKFHLKEVIEPKLAAYIEEAVKERIKPKQVQIDGVFSIQTFAENGIEKVKQALIDAREAATPAEIRYLGAGKYKITVTAEEFKDAEKRLKAANDSMEKSFKNDALAEIGFERIETD
jgi:translation initiation factor 2 subunit 1